MLGGESHAPLVFLLPLYLSAALFDRCASFTAPCAVGNTFRLSYPFGHFRLLPGCTGPYGGLTLSHRTIVI